MHSVYILGGTQTATVYSKMNNPTVKKLWRNFTLNRVELQTVETDRYIFSIGEVQPPVPEAGKEFALTVSDSGICVVGADFGGLMRGFFSLLLKFEHIDGTVQLRHTTAQSHYTLRNRMIHLCVFPENSLYFIKKLIRLSALCQYTHVVIEFWGMLQYDCLRELAWPHAFSKQQAAELITECRELGIEPIPMFNQLGHAAASRGIHGKHVVLDQNPALQELFMPDGWVWNIQSEKTWELLGQVRQELYELFDGSRFMHIGCDEADYINQHAHLRQEVFPQYLRRLTKAVVREGKRPMMWADMLLEKGKFPNCYATGTADEVATLRNALAQETVLIDWQYSCSETPIPTLESLKNERLDCMGAPWSEELNQRAHIETIAANNMFGIMLTTWDTLQTKLPRVWRCAKLCGADGFAWSNDSNLVEVYDKEAAVLMRRVSFEGNDYASAGWSTAQVVV